MVEAVADGPRGRAVARERCRLEQRAERLLPLFSVCRGGACWPVQRSIWDSAGEQLERCSTPTFPLAGPPRSRARPTRPVEVAVAGVQGSHLVVCRLLRARDLPQPSIRPRCSAEARRKGHKVARRVAVVDGALPPRAVGHVAAREMEPSMGGAPPASVAPLCSPIASAVVDLRRRGPRRAALNARDGSREHLGQHPVRHACLAAQGQRGKACPPIGDNGPVAGVTSPPAGVRAVVGFAEGYHAERDHACAGSAEKVGTWIIARK